MSDGNAIFWRSEAKKVIGIPNVSYKNIAFLMHAAPESGIRYVESGNLNDIMNKFKKIIRIPYISYENLLFWSSEAPEYGMRYLELGNRNEITRNFKKIIRIPYPECGIR